jgi:hypothetical protein
MREDMFQFNILSCTVLIQVAVLVLGLSGVMLVSFRSNPATWFLSLQDMMAVPSVKVAVELVSTLIQPLTSVSGQVSCD